MKVTSLEQFEYDEVLDDIIDGVDSENLFGDDWNKVRKFHINGVSVKALAERVQYYDSDGKLVTESFKDYTPKTMAQQFASLD